MKPMSDGKRNEKNRIPTMLRIVKRLGGFVSNIIAQMKRGVRRMNSLQDVIYRLEKVIQTGATDKDGMHPISAERVLEELKSITDRPQGEWIDIGWKGDWQFETDGRGNCWYEYECSECGFHSKGSKSNFCPHCGARMKDVTEGLESRTDLIWYGDKTDLIGDETGRHTGWFGKGADDEDN